MVDEGRMGQEGVFHKANVGICVPLLCENCKFALLLHTEIENPWIPKFARIARLDQSSHFSSI